MEVVKVLDRQYYGKAVLLTDGNEKYAVVSPNLSKEKILYTMTDFEKYFLYADGRKIGKDELREHMTIECRRNVVLKHEVRKDGNEWLVRTVNFEHRIGGKTFAVCFEPVNNSGDTEESKEAKRLPITENLRITAYVITKSGEIAEPVNIRIQGGKLVYGVKGIDLIRKPVEEGYKTVGTLTRGIKKAIEELVWDGSNHVVGFEIRDYGAKKAYKLEV